MEQPILTVHDLAKHFEQKNGDGFVAVDCVSFSMRAGECVGLVGGSGCGKSTIAKMLCGLLPPTSGQIVLCGREVAYEKGVRSQSWVQAVQMVFQNPISSFDPRRTLGDGISESLRNLGVPKNEALRRARSLLEQCGLSPDIADRFPREVSGGQCQRAAIARALAPDPSLIICDEATSALDVTVQAQVVQLLARIQQERGLALLFVCHDLALVQGFCDRVLVMQAGRIVEQGVARTILAHPQHPYTQQLLASTLN